MKTDLILAIAGAHFMADFVFQTDWMAKGKSSSNYVLSVHVWFYTFVLALLLLLFKMVQWYPVSNGDIGTLLAFACLNGGLHWITDWCTSRITKRLWAAQQVHWFFVVIGFDQLLHYAALILTAERLGL